MQDVQALLPNGTIVQDRYVVEDLLGRGGFGAVYRVRDLRVRGNVFALKEIIDTSKQERDRFTFEGEVLKRLDERSLPRVYRVFEDDKNARSYMLMDYIEGPNLEISRNQQPDKRFSVEQTLDIMAPIFEAVSYLHRQEPPIIHRDIKPANIIVPAAGDEAVLVDFGIAKEYNVDATTTAVRRCSPGYGAPEQYARGTNPRTDIYGLAATLYVLLTGVVPIDAFYRMTQIGGKKIDPLEPVAQKVPSIPQSVSDAIQKAMAINSADRFANVEEFWQALNVYRGGDPLPVPVAVPASIPEAAPQQEAAFAAVEQEPVTVVNRPIANANSNRRRRGAFLLLFTALVLLALVGGLVFGNFHLFSSDASGRPTPAAPVAAGKKATTTPTARATATSKATAKPTSRPTSAPTTAPPATEPASTPPPTTAPAPAGYPTLAATYTGSVTDQITNPPTQGNLTLSRIGQNNPNISGYADITGSLQGSGNFNGQVTTGKAISFLVEGFGGHPPLYFTGQIDSNGNMSGNYCSYRNNACDFNSGGYGVWQASAVRAAGSS